MSRVDHLLIFEPEITGHQPLFILLLYNYLVENESKFKVTFLVNPELNRRLAESDGVRLRTVEDRIDLAYLDQSEISASLCDSLWIRALNRWNLMKKHLIARGADHGHFLYLDHIQLPLALKLPFVPGKKISGLLFQPPISGFLDDKLNALEFVRDCRKKIFYASMLKNASLAFAYTLNPLFPRYAAKRFFNGEKILHLPDPCAFPTVRVPSESKERLFAGLAGNKRKIFLLFGTLAERKGIFEVVDALARLESEYIYRATFVFAGKLEDRLRSEFRSKLADLERSRPNADLLLEDRYLTTNEIVGLLELCDIVLTPYRKNFIGSSGTLMWAAGAGKPVIAPNYGLLGYLVRKYDLGISADVSQPEIMAEVFRRCLDDPAFCRANTDGMKRLRSIGEPAMFARIFFSRFSP